MSRKQFIKEYFEAFFGGLLVLIVIPGAVVLLAIVAIGAV